MLAPLSLKILLKHAFRGRTNGEVAASRRGSPDGGMSLCVRDNGTWLPPGLDWRHAHPLGLQLVQILAGQLHATVEVSSGEGTEFLAHGGKTQGMSTATILIVEDEGTGAEDLAGKLRRLGHEVVGIASKGDEAVALACRLRPQLVLMDIWLEGPLDGIEAADAIRRQHDAPVIYLTAHSDPATLARAKITDPFGYILKPCDERELATQIELALYKHQADRQLRQQRDWLRVTLTSIGDAVIAADAEGRVTFVNPAAEALTGWKSEEASGRPVQHVFRTVNEQTGERLEEPVARVLREGRAIELANHAALLTQDGRAVPIQDSAAPILDAAGRVIGVVLVFHDVTEKRRAAEALRESRERLAWVLDTTGVGLWLNELPLGRLNWDNRTRELFFISPGVEPTIELFWERLHPEDCEPTRLAVEAAVRDRTLYAIDHRTVHPETGEVRWIHSAGQASYAADGTPIRFDGINYDITERKRAEEQVRLAFGRLQTFFDQGIGGIGIVVANAKGDILQANDDFLNILGCTREELVSGQLDWRHMTPPEWLPTDEHALAQLRERGVSGMHEKEYVRRDGSRVPVLLTGAMMPGDSGDILAFVWDITTRKRAEEALRERERFIQSVAEASPHWLYVFDFDSLGLSYANRPILRDLGYPPEVQTAVAGLDAFRTFIPPEELPHLARLIDEWQTLPDGLVRDDEYCLYQADGTLRHFAGREIVFARRSDGTVQRILGSLLDVTDRRRTEEQARLLAEVLVQLLASDQPQQIVEALCRRVMDHLGCHVFLNFLLDEESGRLHLNACAGIPDDAAREIEWLDYGVAVCGCAARDGCRIVAEHIQTTTDSRTELIRGFGLQAYACHPLMNQNRTIGTLSFGSRVTPTFTADELGLMKAVADHVAIAMQRIRLLESLERHARAAQAASEAKSQFLANMSHELRTPMNAILGLIDVALPKTVDPTVQDCLQTAKGSADLLLTLLDDLLDSAKIESGKLELELAPFSLLRMLEHITRVLSVRANEKGLCFSCRTPEGTLDAVIGDRTRLQQVLLNLAGNAIKFTERGQVEISLRASSHDGEASLEFAVRDTGIGIPRDGLEHLFQPFAQGDASMSRRFGGTGLGLSISKKLVEMMGGTIWVESEMGKGSTFSFTVRLSLPKELPPDFESPVAPPATPCAPLRILLVEDNPANQKLAAYILQDRGHVVEIAGDGQEAIRLAEQHPYDAILMDLHMPGMNGLTATAAIRKRENAGKRVPIIAVTAHAMMGDRERCLAEGMDGYIAKPVNGPEMIALVESLAHGRAPRAEVAADSPRWADVSPQARAPVFSPEGALARCLNRADMVRKMAQWFSKEVDNLLLQMRAALQNGDYMEVGRLGHWLKGTVVYLGAQPTLQAVLRVEQVCTCSGGMEAEQAINALERECRALRTALTEYTLSAESTQDGSR